MRWQPFLRRVVLFMALGMLLFGFGARLVIRPVYESRAVLLSPAGVLVSPVGMSPAVLQQVVVKLDLRDPKTGQLWTPETLAELVWIEAPAIPAGEAQAALAPAEGWGGGSAFGFGLPVGLMARAPQPGLVEDVLRTWGAILRDEAHRLALDTLEQRMSAGRRRVEAAARRLEQVEARSKPSDSYVPGVEWGDPVRSEGGNIPRRAELDRDAAEAAYREAAVALFRLEQLRTALSEGATEAGRVSVAPGLLLGPTEERVVAQVPREAWWLGALFGLLVAVLL